MLKRFLDGLVFGAGFAIALFAIWLIGMTSIAPRMMESMTTRTKQPEFNHPTEAKVAAPDPAAAASDKRDFSLFKDSGERMKIPPGGGLLAVSPIATAQGSKRPSTYQLWLTDSKLWQVRTVEEKVDIEELPYPKNANVTDLDDLMHKSLGFGARQITMTVSADELRRLKSTGNASRDESLNGKLRISTEGVVFIQPNPYSLRQPTLSARTVLGSGSLRGGGGGIGGAAAWSDTPGW
jgi:hypothetical protein